MGGTFPECASYVGGIQKSMRMLRTVVGIALGMLLLPSRPRRRGRLTNGNGTFTNPLFYDEFSDPDMIRVETEQSHRKGWDVRR
jgi:hypothetical protein